MDMWAIAVTWQKPAKILKTIALAKVHPPDLYNYIIFSKFSILIILLIILIY